MFHLNCLLYLCQNIVSTVRCILRLNSFGAKFQTTFVVCFFYFSKLSFIGKVERLIVKQHRSRWDGSLSRLIWIYAVCKSLLLSPVGVKELSYIYVQMLIRVLKCVLCYLEEWTWFVPLWILLFLSIVYSNWQWNIKGLSSLKVGREWKNWSDEF